MKTLEGQIDYHISPIPTIEIPQNHIISNREITQPIPKPIKRKRKTIK
jgi:hypothetical protein